MLEGEEKPTWHSHITGETSEGRKEIELNEGKLTDFLKQRVSDGEGRPGERSKWQDLALGQKH